MDKFEENKNYTENRIEKLSSNDNKDRILNSMDKSEKELFIQTGIMIIVSFMIICTLILWVS